MKLDDLRKRLRRPKPKLTPKKPKLTPTPSTKPTPKPGRCERCRRPREPAKLTDPDVAQILMEDRSGPGATHAFRCRPCGIIWLVGPIEPQPDRKGPISCAVCEKTIPESDGKHFLSGFKVCKACSVELTGET